MPLDEPTISAICDKCDEVSDPMTMTALAGGGWDSRNIPRRLERDGWRIEGHKLTCPECIALEEEEAQR